VKATGIVRKVDELGRIVLPIEMRRTLDIAEKDALEIYVEGSSVILKKYKPSCIFCDSSRDITEFKGKNVCPKCLNELYAAALKIRKTAVQPDGGFPYFSRAAAYSSFLERPVCSATSLAASFNRCP